MTKEWQEATNEYLKVSYQRAGQYEWILTSNRKKESTPSTVSAAKAIVERVSCRVSLQRFRESLLNRMNRCVDYRDGCTSLTKFFTVGRVVSQAGFVQIIRDCTTYTSCTEFQSHTRGWFIPKCFQKYSSRCIQSGIMCKTYEMIECHEEPHREGFSFLFTAGEGSVTKERDTLLNV